MDITKETILGLSIDQAKNFHQKVVEFLNNNYKAVIDGGLMDEVLMNEYKASVAKLDNSDIAAWLGNTLWQVVLCASANLAKGKTDAIYADLIKCVAEVV